jgi:hypothetical protein
MSDELVPFTDKAFAEPLEQLKDLLSQSRRAFLFGAGCSACAGLPLMRDLTDKVLSEKKMTERTKTILQSLQKIYGQSQSATIEDYMSEMVDWLSIAERRSAKGNNSSPVQLGGEGYSLGEISTALDETKTSIASQIESAKIDLQTHRKFVRIIHRTLQSGKSTSGRIVDYFVLNYDTLVEDSLGMERVVYADGFEGGTTAWWNEKGFHREDVAARVFKIHGSIDWCPNEKETLPRRVRPQIRSEATPAPVLIYPAATKYQEAQRDPFAQILSFLRQSLRPSQGLEIVLAICGYGFGDTHINFEIDQALHDSEQRLTIVAFTSDDTPQGKLREWLGDSTLRDQVRVYANKGFFHGAEKRESRTGVPWWKFEILTRLLGGE